MNACMRQSEWLEVNEWMQWHEWIRPAKWMGMLRELVTSNNIPPDRERLREREREREGEGERDHAALTTDSILREVPFLASARSS